eukprot:14543625-Alexandrium_andersonii.AAC.1
MRPIRRLLVRSSHDGEVASLVLCNADVLVMIIRGFGPAHSALGCVPTAKRSGGFRTGDSRGPNS